MLSNCFSLFPISDKQNSSFSMLIQPSLCDRLYGNTTMCYSLYIFDSRSSDFVNQLVATAVSAAGQAYITTKAVFKTWQEKKVGTLLSTKI